MDAEFTVEQFKSTDFRFRCRRLCLIDPVSTDMINSVISCFKGRQVFEFFFIARQPDELPVLNTEPELFNQMLADLEIKEFVWGSLPVYWFELPAVKTLVRLHSNTCPPRLSYLLGSAAHSIAFSFEENEERPDSADMHDILAQWAAGEKEIREYNINNFNVNPVDLIGDWPLVAAFQELPEERPVFVWVGEDVRFRIIRADGEELRVFICGHHNAEGRHLHDISFVDKDHPPFCGSHDHEHNNDEEPAGELHHEDQEHNHDEEPPAEDGEEEEPQVRPGEEEVSRRRQRDCCIM